MTEKKLKEGIVLIVDDNKGVLEALKLFLKPEFQQVIALPGPNTLK
jgi:hypothetical protein